MIEASFIKLEGSAFPAPCIDVGVGRGWCTCRLDTGADLTVLPKYILTHEGFKLNEAKVKVGSFCGETRLYNTYRGWIFIDGRDIYLKRVIATPKGSGLLGLDVLNRFSILIAGATIILE